MKVLYNQVLSLFWKVLISSRNRRKHMKIGVFEMLHCCYCVKTSSKATKSRESTSKDSHKITINHAQINLEKINHSLSQTQKGILKAINLITSTSKSPIKVTYGYIKHKSTTRTAHAHKSSSRVLTKREMLHLGVLELSSGFIYKETGRERTE